MLFQPSSRKGRPPQRHKYTKKYNRIAPSSPQASQTIWGNQCGSDDRDCHTQSRRTIVSQRCRDTIDKCCAPNSHIATVWTCPTPTDTHTHTPRGDGQTTHTQSKQSRCVPFSDPHVHKVARSNDTRQGCNHSSANTLGPVHHMARTHQADDKSKGRKKEGVHQQRVLC